MIVRAIILKQHRCCVLAVENLEFPPGERFFGLPGGTVEYGESIQNALIRETKEETGLTISKSAIFTGQYYRHGMWSRFFVVRGYHGKLNKEPFCNPHTEEPEDGVPAWISVKDIFSDSGKLVFNPQHKKMLRRYLNL